MDVFESILISGLSWWQINSSNIKRLLCMSSTLSLPVNRDVTRGERASMVVPAGRPKLTRYLPSIRPSRFATLGLHKACVCVGVCVFLFAFTLLSSSYRQVRSVSSENLSRWSLRHNWTGHLFLFFLPLCAQWIVICSFLKGLFDKYTEDRAEVARGSGATNKCRKVQTSWI